MGDPSLPRVSSWSPSEPKRLVSVLSHDPRLTRSSLLVPPRTLRVPCIWVTLVGSPTGSDTYHVLQPSPFTSFSPFWNLRNVCKVSKRGTHYPSAPSRSPVQSSYWSFPLRLSFNRPLKRDCNDQSTLFDNTKTPILVLLGSDPSTTVPWD